jgi:hypothetical protein
MTAFLCPVIAWPQTLPEEHKWMLTVFDYSLKTV